MKQTWLVWEKKKLLRFHWHKGKGINERGGSEAAASPLPGIRDETAGNGTTNARSERGARAVTTND